MNPNHFYNKDQILSLIRGIKEKMLDLFLSKSEFLEETWGADHKDKHIFIIRRGSNVGLFSYFLTTLSGIKYALDRDWIPVVDMRSLPNIYLERDEVGRINAWDFYFEQPCGLTLDDVAQASYVTITKDFSWPELPPADIDFLRDRNGKLTYWRNLVSKYVRIKDSVLASCNKEAHRVFGGVTNDVLGVFVRGSDYARLHPVGHTVQPTADRAITDAKQIMSTEGYKRIFLVSEDRGIIESFRAEFGNNLVMREQNLVEYNGGYIGECRPRIKREKERYLQGLEYLENIILLTKCPRLLASRASGSIAVALLGDGNQRVDYYDLGVYTRRI